MYHSCAETKINFRAPRSDFKVSFRSILCKLKLKSESVRLSQLKCLWFQLISNISWKVSNAKKLEYLSWGQQGTMQPAGLFHFDKAKCLSETLPTPGIKKNCLILHCPMQSSLSTGLTKMILGTASEMAPGKLLDPHRHCYPCLLAQFHSVIKITHFSLNKARYTQQQLLSLLSSI